MILNSYNLWFLYSVTTGNHSFISGFLTSYENHETLSNYDSYITPFSAYWYSFSPKCAPSRGSLGCIAAGSRWYGRHSLVR